MCCNSEADNVVRQHCRVFMQSGSAQKYSLFKICIEEAHTVICRLDDHLLGTSVYRLPFSKFRSSPSL